MKEIELKFTDKSVGIKQTDAAQELLKTVDEYISKEVHIKSAWTLGKEFLLLRRTLFALFAAVLSLVCFFLFPSDNKYGSIKYKCIVEFVVCIISIVLSVWLHVKGTLHKNKEAVVRVRDLCETYCAAVSKSGYIKKQRFHNKGNNAEIKEYLYRDSLSVVPAFRDSNWMRIPSNLLVKGDIIGLASGQLSPGKVMSMDNFNKKDPFIIEANQPIPNLSEKYEECEKLDFEMYDAIQMMSFCGRMRRYQLLETPLMDILPRVLKPPPRPPGLFDIEIEAGTKFYVKITIYLYIVSIIASIMNVILRPNDYVFDALYMNSVFLYAALPLYMISIQLFLDVVGTARLLTLFSLLNDPTQKSLHEHGYDLKEKNYNDGDSETSSEADDYEDEISYEDIPRLPFYQVLRYIKVIMNGVAPTQDKDNLFGMGIPKYAESLVNQLGSITFLCVADNDVIIESKPLVERLLLPEIDKLNEERPAIIMDLRPDKESATGVAFEDPNWKNHLTLLKPIGLNFLLQANILTDIILHASTSNENSLPGLVNFLRDTSCSASVQQKSLSHVANEIGFCADDVNVFTLRHRFHLLSNELLHKKTALEEGHILPQRYALKTHLTSIIVEDLRNKKLQLLCEGHPELIIDKCTTLWNGENLIALSSETKKFLLDTFHEWQHENLECFAFSYSPILDPYNSSFNAKVVIQDKFMIDESNYESERFKLISPAGVTNQNKINKTKSMAVNQSKRQAKSVSPQKRKSDLDPVASHTILSQAKGEMKNFVNSPSAWLNKDSNESNVIKEGIFLGIAALRVQPRPEVQNFIDILYNAGVRFVHFSPDNFGKSKTLAAKMGLETGFNSAICLSKNIIDPTSNQATDQKIWDEKAKLPHGIDEIRKHLELIDNVPLLVSLFTDSTPSTTNEMIKIMQENGEVVAVVGSAMCLPNLQLFLTADIGIAVHPKLPPENAKLAPSKPDISFGAALNALPCNVHIRNTTNLRALCVGIHEGRRLMYNTRNSLILICFSHILACFLVIMYQFSNVPFLAVGGVVLFILWLILPLISVALLFTQPEMNPGLMSRSRMPRKHKLPGEKEILHDWRRFLTYLILRLMPSILCFPICLTIVLVQNFNTSGFPVSYSDFILSSAPIVDLNDPKAYQAVNLTKDIMVVLFTWAIIWHSSGFAHRTQSIFVEPTFRNGLWIVTCLIALAISVLFASFIWELEDGLHIRIDWLLNPPYWLWIIAIVVWPGLIVTVDELCKKHDRVLFEKYMHGMRLTFDTRLGMYSPK